VRRRSVNPSPDDGLSPDALPAYVEPDPSLSLKEKIAHQERWMKLRNDWENRRARYAELHGWPGGDYARHEEEMQAHPIPDAYFDPDSI